MKKILVSRCLYGDEIVRYDGKEKALENEIFLKWKAEGRLIPVCPEVFGGLETPRIPAERIGERVIRKDGVDVSYAYEAGAEEALRLARENDVAFCILKQGSPSCGSKNIYDGSFSGIKKAGQGVASELLSKSGYMIFDESEIEEACKYLEK